MAEINSFFIAALLAFGLADSCPQAPTRPARNKVEQSTSTATKPGAGHLPITTDPRNLFTLSDAEKILGEPAHLSDSGSTAPGVSRESSPKDSVWHIKKLASSWRCAYQANAEDEKTGRTGIVYFLIEQYPQVTSAATVYSYYKRSNETHPGFKELHGPGWERWSGDSPFSVYMRKDNKILVVKVNKMTSKTSAEGFNQVVEKIAKAF
jgi:hypothetical protein